MVWGSVVVGRSIMVDGGSMMRDCMVDWRVMVCRCIMMDQLFVVLRQCVMGRYSMLFELGSVMWCNMVMCHVSLLMPSHMVRRSMMSFSVVSWHWTVL